MRRTRFVFFVPVTFFRPFLHSSSEEEKNRLAPCVAVSLADEIDGGLEDEAIEEA